MESAVLSDELERLRRANALHFDHYGGNQLPFACLQAKGIVQRFVRLDGPTAGMPFDVLDASGGYGSACLGAGHPVVKTALADALEHAGYTTDEMGSLVRAEMLDELFAPGGLWTEHFPAGEYHVSGRNSGSEGVELALRLAFESRFDRRALAPTSGREEKRTVLAFEGAWHGWTATALACANRRHYRVGLPAFGEEAPYGVHVAFLAFGDTGALESFFAAGGGGVGAVIIEPVQGDAGIIVPPQGYLRRLAELCADHQALLIADEVLTFAKTGRFFAMADADGPIRTDVTVIGKSLGMGVFSTSMVIARKELTVRPSGAVATSDLRPVTCAVVRAGVREIVRERLLERSAETGAVLRAGLQARVADRFQQLYREVRGAGLMNGIELQEEAAAHVHELRTHLIEAGVYLEVMGGAGRRSGGHRFLFPALRVAPPLVATLDDAAHIVDAIAAGSKTFAERG